MKFDVVFYSENPFEKDDSFRISGAALLEINEMNALMLKNYIAFVYYKTDFKKCMSNILDFREGCDSHNQLLLYRSYLKGYLKSSYKKNACISQMLNFYIHENGAFSFADYEDGLCYSDFLLDQSTFFRRVDYLVSLKYDDSVWDRFLDFLNSNHLILPHINLSQVGVALEKYFVVVAKHLCICYVKHYDVSLIARKDYQSYLDEIYLSMNYELLHPEEQEKLVSLSFRWLTQRFKNLAADLNLKYSINIAKSNFVFAPFLQKFTDYFSIGNSKEVVEKSFPTPIFASYEVYQLFHTLAQGLSIKVSVSFVYRFLHEKGLILVKDAPFREWYNQQSYPLTLYTATETLANSKSSEREQFMGILAKLYEVTI